MRRGEVSVGFSNNVALPSKRVRCSASEGNKRTLEAVTSRILVIHCGGCHGGDSDESLMMGKMKRFNGQLTRVVRTRLPARRLTARGTEKAVTAERVFVGEKDVSHSAS